ncbi:hypothetical protein VTL71DRAFT_848 [Oculimacula yallundae]|uniref:C2H2-type domain-containing protein n=1 Tax=Oculimacula yallundae TaxID=86028 RepID=A0ABR4D1F9_9HELO
MSSSSGDASKTVDQCEFEDCNAGPWARHSAYMTHLQEVHLLPDGVKTCEYADCNAGPWALRSAYLVHFRHAHLRPDGIETCEEPDCYAGPFAVRPAYGVHLQQVHGHPAPALVDAGESIGDMGSRSDMEDIDLGGPWVGCRHRLDSCEFPGCVAGPWNSRSNYMKHFQEVHHALPSVDTGKFIDDNDRDAWVCGILVENGTWEDLEAATSSQELSEVPGVLKAAFAITAGTPAAVIIDQVYHLITTMLSIAPGLATHWVPNGTLLTVTRAGTNLDRNAIQALDRGTPVGRLSAPMAAILAPFLDNGTLVVISASARPVHASTQGIDITLGFGAATATGARIQALADLLSQLLDAPGIEGASN